MTKTSNSKMLNITNINKKAKELDKQSQVKVYSSTIDDYFDLKIDDVFKKTKIMKMVSEVMAQIQYAHTHKIDIDSVFLTYSITMLLKYFTSVGKSVPDDLPGQLDIMYRLIDLDILQPILEAMPEDQAEIVFNTVNTAMEDVDKKYNEIAERVVEIQEAFERGEIEKFIELSDEDWIEVATEDENEDKDEDKDEDEDSQER